MEHDRGFTTNLHERRWPLVRLLATRRLSRGDLVDDCVQEVWLRVARHEAAGKPPPDDPTKWLIGLVYHVSREIRRRERWRAASISIEEGKIEIASSQDDPATSYALKEEHELFRRRVMAALTRLSPEDATIVRRHFHERMTFPTIARSLGLPLEHVKYRFRVGLKRLRQLVEHTHTHTRVHGLRFRFDFCSFAPIGVLKSLYWWESGKTLPAEPSVHAVPTKMRAKPQP